MIKSTKQKLEYDSFKRKYICMQFLRTNLLGNFCERMGLQNCAFKSVSKWVKPLG